MEEKNHIKNDNLANYTTKNDEMFLAMQNLIADWSVIYSKENKSLCDNLKYVVEICQQTSNYHKQIMMKHRQDGHLFNVFSLWNRLVGISEPIHSRILHFLLSEDDLHGQGDLFLRELLKMLDVEAIEMGQWISSAETDRIDVRLIRQNPHSVVIIENKSNWAEDQPNQLYRYWYNNIHCCDDDCSQSFYENNNKYRIVYLVPKDGKQPSEQSLSKPSRDWFQELSDKEYELLPQRLPITPIVWTFDKDKHIDQWLIKCEELLDVENTPLRNFIRQYREYCNQL